MRRLIQTTDNSSRKLSQEELSANREHLQLLAKSSIDTLSLNKHSNLLIFPSDYKVHGDDIGRQHIFSLQGDCLMTGNIMGFIGYHGSQISIRSRFAKDDSHDYFLHYMLQRVCALNLFDLKCGSDAESVLDILAYLFPLYLKRALRQGVYKEYRTYNYNDSNVRGRIDIARHIQKNIPFTGKVAYSTREHSTDNHLTQLIRHTVEYIAGQSYGDYILNNDEATRDFVSMIRKATPSYNSKERRQVVNQNLRPVRHPYFAEYRNLQHLCLQILRHEEIKYGYNDNEIYGILFDGAWLWEEYLYTILKDKGFRHPRNKTREGGKRIFSDNNGKESVFPDFYRKDIVLDAKYKGYSNWKEISSHSDHLQLVAYMHLLKTNKSGYLVPVLNGINLTRFLP